MKQILCFIALSLFCQPLHKVDLPQFIIWNVGQGSWSTWVTHRECHHIDMGGTWLPPSSELMRLCESKKNILHITHFDWDHINLIHKAQRHLPLLCRTQKNLSQTNTFKQSWLSKIPVCDSMIKTLNFERIHTSTFSKKNESHIYLVAQKILITGDADQKQEHQLAKLKKLKPVAILILGHHGSRTSTSQALLKALPNLYLTVASSKKSKYGHPHSEVLDRLKRHSLPLLSTENFGSIYLELRN